MRTRIFAVTIILSLVFLCSCGNELPIETTEAVQTENVQIASTPEPVIDYEQIYADVIAENSHDGTGIFLNDLDGDGVPELFIGMTNGDIYQKQQILKMYTVKDNEVTPVFACEDRDEYYITNNGTIVEYNYKNAYDSYHAYYSYSSCELKEIIVVGFDLRDNAEMPYYKQEAGGEKVTVDETQYFDWVQMYESTYESPAYA